MKQVTQAARRSPAIFAQLYKVDEEKRLIYARAASEEPDHSNEMMDYTSSKPLFQKWSSEVHRDSGGKSFGNVREMHQPQAVGKLTEIEFDDANQSVDVVLKVVDNDAWDKVLEGVYTGLSIGGKYIRKWDAIVDGERVKKYTAHPSEVSLVDRPCMPSSKFFEVMKRDGSVEQHEFALTKGDDEERDDHGRWTSGGEADSQQKQGEAHAKVAAAHREIAAKKDTSDWDRQRHEDAAKSHDRATKAYSAAAKAYRQNDDTNGSLWADRAEKASHSANFTSRILGVATSHSYRKTVNGGDLQKDAGLKNSRVLKLAKYSDDFQLTNKELTDMAKLLERAAGRVAKDWRSPAGDTSGITPQASDDDDKPAGNRMKRPADDPDAEDVSGDGGESEVATGPKGSTSTTKFRKRAYTDQERQEAARTGAAMPDGSFPIHDRADLENAIQAHGRAKNPAKAKAHIKARAKALGHSDALPADWKGVKKSLAFHVDSVTDDDLQKGTHAVGSLAQLIAGLESWSEQQVWEDKAEGQDKPTGIAGKVKGQVVQLLGLLAEYAEEEAEELKELTAGECEEDHGPTVFTMSEKLGDLFKRARRALEKKGARNSKTDQGLLQKLHDTAVALGADCGSAKITPIGKSTGDTHMRVRKGGIETEGRKRGSTIGQETDSEHSDNEEHDGEEGTASGTERRESKGGNVNSKRGVGKAQQGRQNDDDEDDDEDDEDDMDDEEDEKPAKKVAKGNRVSKRRDEDDDMTSADLAKMVASTVVATLQGLGIIEPNEQPVRKSRRRDEDDGDEDLAKFARRPALFAVDKNGDTEELNKGEGTRQVRDTGDPLELALQKRVAQPIVQNNGKMDVASTLIKHIHGSRPMKTVTADGMSLKN